MQFWDWKKYKDKISLQFFAGFSFDYDYLSILWFFLYVFDLALHFVLPEKVLKASK